jgi:hypothetical protein
MKRDWHDHKYMCIVGCIDSHGAITARACKEVEAHSRDELRGKRWRWMIWTQEFHALPPRTVYEANNRIAALHLSEEENVIVLNWLVEHGYADELLLSMT